MSSGNSHDERSAATRPERVCDAASERALEASAALMAKFDEANRAAELLGGMTGVQSHQSYLALRNTLAARASAFLEAANTVEYHFAVSRHPEFDDDA